MEYPRDDGEKPLTVEELKEALLSLPGNYKVRPNYRRNLVIFNDEGKYCGYIDFSDGHVEIFDQSYVIMEYNRGNKDKPLTVKELKEALLSLPEDYMVLPNVVRNLVILNEEERYCGYINFFDAHVEIFDQRKN